ncbi:MAG: flagellar biosynthesis protein FlhB [Chloroflexi bacterium]|nr:flagellar biosynthesis protein FlhB [Chloroflexota bacterium]
MAGEERTEAATPRKLQHLRDEGKVSKSAEVCSAAAILGGILILQGFSGYLSGNLHGFLQDQFSTLARPDLTDRSLGELGLTAAAMFFVLAAPLLVAMPAIGIVANVAQSGLLVSGKLLSPDLERINPLAGFKRLISPRILVELLKTLAKVGLVGYLLYRTYLDSLPTLLSLAGADVAGGLRLLSDTAFKMGLTVGGAFLAIAVLDYGYQRWEFLRGARMTKQEIKEEYRQSEGAPEIKAAVRRRQKRLAMSRMMQNVPKADVVVTNPTHFAVALVYRGDDMTAPKVVAKGKDLIAARIKQIAAEHGVPIVENKPLAQALYRTVEVDREIPYELFQAVAQVLAYIYSLKRRATRSAVSPMRSAAAGTVIPPSTVSAVAAALTGEA